MWETSRTSNRKGCISVVVTNERTGCPGCPTTWECKFMMLKIYTYPINAMWDIQYVIPSVKTYYIMSRLRLKRNERTPSHGCGVIVGGRIFAKWWGGGEHHCGRCNYQSPGYSLSENIWYNVETKAKKKREDFVPWMWCNCGFIEKVSYGKISYNLKDSDVCGQMKMMLWQAMFDLRPHESGLFQECPLPLACVIQRRCWMRVCRIELIMKGSLIHRVSIIQGNIWRRGDA